jgi:hypothetical protein
MSAVAYTADPLVAVGTVAELADWLRLDDDTDPVLPGLLLEATDMVRSHIGKELEPREYVAEWQHWPMTGTPTHPNLSPQNITYLSRVKLPWTALLSVESVEVYGESAGYTAILPRGEVCLPRIVTLEEDCEDPAVRIEYTAGFNPVPDSIVQAVIRVAGYLFSKRGACETVDPIVESGAAQLLRPYRNAAVMGVL